MASKVSADMVDEILWQLRMGQSCVAVGKNLHMSHNTPRAVLRGQMKVMTEHQVAEAKSIRAMGHRSQRISLVNYRKGKNRLKNFENAKENAQDTPLAGDNQAQPGWHLVQGMQYQVEDMQKQLDAANRQISILTKERDRANALADMLLAHRQQASDT